MFSAFPENTFSEKLDIINDPIGCSSIGGGVTNHLFHCCVGSKEIDSCDFQILFRIYGHGTDKLVDRSKETGVLVGLSERGYATGLLATFTNGRIERFIPGRVLTIDEMSSAAIQPVIARNLAKLHKVDMHGDKENASAWITLQKWLGVLASLENQKKDMLEGMPMNLERMQKEIELLKDRLEKRNLPLAFGHNDLQPLNIILRQGSRLDSLEDEDVVFIDFEYSGYNYRGLDIANHFCEYMGFDPIQWSKFPSAESRASFLHHYAKAMYGNTRTLSEVVAEMEEELQLFIPLSDVFWGVWGMIQAQTSDIDFDFKR